MCKSSFALFGLKKTPHFSVLLVITVTWTAWQRVHFQPLVLSSSGIEMPTKHIYMTSRMANSHVWHRLLSNQWHKIDTYITDISSVKPDISLADGYVRMMFTNKLEFTQWLQASNIPSGLTSTQYHYYEYKPPEELGLRWNILCEWAQIGRSKVRSRTTTRYNICKK